MLASCVQVHRNIEVQETERGKWHHAPLCKYASRFYIARPSGLGYVQDANWHATHKRRSQSSIMHPGHADRKV
eukprot:852642-Pelagomonas_calceolata.AAC.2